MAFYMQWSMAVQTIPSENKFGGTSTQSLMRKKLQILSEWTRGDVLRALSIVNWIFEHGLIDLGFTGIGVLSVLKGLFQVHLKARLNARRSKKASRR